MEIKKLKAVELPRSTKDIPVSQPKQKPKKPTTDPAQSPSDKQITEENNLIIVRNSWSNETGSSTKVGKTVYFKEADLSNLNNLPNNEQKENMRITYQGSHYILRKTSLDIVRAVMNIYPKIKNHVENIVGYLITLSGSIYLITKIKSTLLQFSPDYLNEDSKLNMLEQTIEHLVELNKKNLLLINFSQKNIFYSGKQVFLGDLRNLRMSLKPSAILASLKTFLYQLLRSGSITNDELIYLLTYYMGGNPDVCFAWFKDKNNRDGEEVEVLEALETEVTRPPLV